MVVEPSVLSIVGTTIKMGGVDCGGMRPRRPVRGTVCSFYTFSWEVACY